MFITSFSVRETAKYENVVGSIIERGTSVAAENYSARYAWLVRKSRKSLHGSRLFFFNIAEISHFVSQRCCAFSFAIDEVIKSLSR